MTGGASGDHSPASAGGALALSASASAWALGTATGRRFALAPEHGLRLGEVQSESGDACRASRNMGRAILCEQRRTTMKRAFKFLWDNKEWIVSAGPLLAAGLWGVLGGTLVDLSRVPALSLALLIVFCVSITAVGFVAIRWVSSRASGLITMMVQARTLVWRVRFTRGDRVVSVTNDPYCPLHYPPSVMDYESSRGWICTQCGFFRRPTGVGSLSRDVAEELTALLTVEGRLAEFQWDKDVSVAKLRELAGKSKG